MYRFFHFSLPTPILYDTIAILPFKTIPYNREKKNIIFRYNPPPFPFPFSFLLFPLTCPSAHFALHSPPLTRHLTILTKHTFCPSYIATTHIRKSTSETLHIRKPAMEILSVFWGFLGFYWVFFGWGFFLFGFSGNQLEGHSL